MEMESWRQPGLYWSSCQCKDKRSCFLFYDGRRVPWKLKTPERPLEFMVLRDVFSGRFWSVPPGYVSAWTKSVLKVGERFLTMFSVGPRWLSSWQKEPRPGILESGFWFHLCRWLWCMPHASQGWILPCKRALGLRDCFCAPLLYHWMILEFLSRMINLEGDFLIQWPKWNPPMISV